MRNFGKVFIFATVSIGFVPLAFTLPVHALVIAAPLVAISAFKASVFLISMLSVPVITLIQVIKKWGVLKTIAVALLLLGLVFGTTYGLLSLIKEKAYGSKVKEDSANRTVDFGAPSYADKMPEQAQPLDRRYVGQPASDVKVMSSSPILLVGYLILVGAVFVIILIPIFLILITVKKIRNDRISLWRILAVGILISVVISIPLSFFLGLFYAITTRTVVVY